jgi:hypothetical protein
MISSNTQFPAGSIELLGVDVLAGPTRVTAGVQLGLLSEGTPRDQITWQTPTVIGQRWGLLLDGLRAPGIYEVWAKLTASPEIPLIPCGTITLY